MADNTSSIAGNYPGGIVVTCILDEGAPTVASTSYDQLGQSAKGLTWASELAEGDMVAISNDTAGTYVACEGLPLVEKAVDGETLVIGQIVGTPRLMAFPAASADANTLAERLAGKYYRVANVKLMGGITAIQEGVVMCDGTNACVQGVGATLKLNITSTYANHKLTFDSAASGGVGVIPFHYVPAGTDGDTYSCLVGITGMLIAATGA